MKRQLLARYGRSRAVCGVAGSGTEPPAATPVSDDLASGRVPIADPAAQRLEFDHAVADLEHLAVHVPSFLGDLDQVAALHVLKPHLATPVPTMTLSMTRGSQPARIERPGDRSPTPSMVPPARRSGPPWLRRGTR